MYCLYRVIRHQWVRRHCNGVLKWFSQTKISCYLVNDRYRFSTDRPIYWSIIKNIGRYDTDPIMPWMTDSTLVNVASRSLYALHYTALTLRLRVRPIHTSHVGNIGESAASVCQCVIVIWWHTFNKPHSQSTVHVSSTWLQVLDRWPAGKVKCSYVIIIVTVSVCDMTRVV